MIGRFKSRLTGENPLFVIFLAALTVLPGCKEDGGGNGSPNGDSLSLPGNLFYYEGRYGENKDDAYLRLNLDSLSADILITDLGYSFSSSDDGDRLLRVDSSRTVIHTYSGSGNLLKSIDVNYQVSSEPRYSPDNQYIAFLFKDNSANYYLGILTAEGDLVRALSVDNDGVIKRGPSGIDWTPDGQIMFTGYGRIYRLADINEGDLEVITNFGSDIEVYGLRVSPDGKKVAFLMDDFEAFYHEGNLYVMNSDGTGLQELAHRSELYAFTRLAWAPSGKYISAIFGEYRGDSSGSRGCGAIWIFDSGSSDVAYITEDTSASEVPGSFKIESTDYEVHGLCPSNGLDWR